MQLPATVVLNISSCFLFFCLVIPLPVPLPVAPVVLQVLAL